MGAFVNRHHFRPTGPVWLRRKLLLTAYSVVDVDSITAAAAVNNVDYRRLMRLRESTAACRRHLPDHGPTNVGGQVLVKMAARNVAAFRCQSITLSPKGRLSKCRVVGVTNESWLVGKGR